MKRGSAMMARVASGQHAKRVVKARGLKCLAEKLESYESLTNLCMVAESVESDERPDDCKQDEGVLRSKQKSRLSSALP